MRICLRSLLTFLPKMVKALAPKRRREGSFLQIGLGQRAYNTIFSIRK